MSDILGAAHDYARRGWRVIPLHSVGPDGVTCSCKRGRNCESKGKHPINGEWQKTPPLSGADIEAIWERRPNANVGIATGEPSGFWVLDIDPDKGGLESARRLAAEHGPFYGETLMQQTGSGGFHMLYAMPDFAVTNSPGRLGERVGPEKDSPLKYPGIDVRGTGGQIVATPSRSDKGDYRWLDADREIVAAPDWLLEMIRPTANSTGVIVDDENDTSVYDAATAEEQRRLNAYTMRAIGANEQRLLALTEKGWDGEPWDATCFEIACSLIEIANSPWNTISRQMAYNLFFERAPRDANFNDDTVNEKWRSAINTVDKKARPFPPGQAALPDFFSGPEVRKAPDPSRGDADPSPKPERRDPHDFLDPRDGLRTQMLAKAVLDEGPLAWGIDGGFWSYDHGVWQSDHKESRRRAAMLLGNLFRTGHATNVSEYLEHAVPKIGAHPLPDIINFGNGILDWRTLTLSSHTPDILSTIQMGTDWDPDATCPAFDAFLDQVLHPDYLAMAWEMIGYLMFSGNPLQVAFLLLGTGGNGKGTLIRTVQALLGGSNVANESLDDLNNGRFNTANLFGKIANIAGDIDATYQETTAMFKKLTGEDTISAEKKHRDAFSFENWAVPIFSANKIPGSADVTEGYLRRWVVIHFPHQFSGDDRDNSLSNRLVAELPGIANKAVRALQTLMARGRFNIQGQAAKGREEFAEALDQVRQWVADSTHPAPGHFVARTQAYNDYQVWAKANGIGVLRSPEFYHRLEALGVPKAKRNGTHGFKGIFTSPTRINQAQAALEPEEDPITKFWRDVQ